MAHEEALLHRPRRQLRASVKVKFAQDVLNVDTSGSFRDPQCLRDLPVREPAGDERDYLPLSPCELRAGRLGR